MIAGAVAPPRLDLLNEEFIRLHLNAAILMDLGGDLHLSVAEALAVTRPELPLQDGLPQKTNWLKPLSNGWKTFYSHNSVPSWESINNI
jgi:hypothetical protein